MVDITQDLRKGHSRQYEDLGEPPTSQERNVAEGNDPSEPMESDFDFGSSGSSSSSGPWKPQSPPKPVPEPRPSGSRPATPRPKSKPEPRKPQRPSTPKQQVKRPGPVTPETASRDQQPQEAPPKRGRLFQSHPVPERSNNLIMRNLEPFDPANVWGWGRTENRRGCSNGLPA